MKTKRVLTIILAAVLLAIPLSACTGGGDSGSDEPITLVMWHTLTEQHEEALLKIISDFNDSQDKYIMIAEQQPWAEMDAKLMQATRTGTGPDITSMWPTTAVQYMTEGLLVDFAPFINDPQTGIPNFRERLSPGLFAEITQWGEGQVYLFPATGTGEVLFYNKTMFDELGISAPKTWSDVEAYSKLILQERGIPGFGTDSVTDTFQTLVMQRGGGYINGESRTINMNRGIAIDMLNWFGTGIKDGYFRLVGEDRFFSNPFGSQAVASYIGSSAGIPFVLGAVGGEFELGVVPVPQEGGTLYVSAWGNGFACFSKDEEKARGVFEFMKYYIQTDVVMYWAEQFGSIPYYLDVLETDRFKAFAETNQAINALAQQLAHAGFLPSVLGSAGVRILLDEMVVSVALGVNNAEDAFDLFVTSANAEMARSG